MPGGPVVGSADSPDVDAIVAVFGISFSQMFFSQEKTSSVFRVTVLGIPGANNRDRWRREVRGSQRGSLEANQQRCALI